MLRFRRMIVPVGLLAIALAVGVGHSQAVEATVAEAAKEPNRIVELGFEEGEIGQAPRDWFVPNGWSAVLTDADAADGKCSVKLELKGESTAPWGNMTHVVDAITYRGRHVRLTARIRVEGSDGRAMMWLRADRTNGQMGFFDNMGDRPITSSKWADAVIEGDIDSDAQQLVMGVMSFGGVQVFVDAMRLEDLRAASIQEATAPRALTRRGVENLQAGTRLLAYVRFFHPSDEALAVKAWDHFAVQLMEETEPATDAADLARRLQNLFAPIAPTLAVWAGGPNDAPALPKVPPEATSLRYWRHLGAGRIASPGSIYSSQTRTLPVHGKEKTNSSLSNLVESSIKSFMGGEAGTPPPSPFLVLPLGGGVTCRLPVMVYEGRDGSLPRATAENPWRELAQRPKLTALNRSTRLAGVAIAWGVMQHFYPYFDVVQTDWDAALTAALSKAAEDADDVEYLRTLQGLIAKLQDGHGNVYNARLQVRKMLPLAMAWAGPDLVVVGKHDSAPATIAAGDAIVTINDRSVQEQCEALSQRISAATDGWRRTQLLAALRCVDPGPDSVRLRLRKPDGQEYDSVVSQIAPTVIADVTNKKPDNGSEVAPGIVYFDLNGAETEALQPHYEKLAAARAVVFDLRGYPGSGAMDLIRHLIDEPATSAQWNTPIVTLPDRDRWEWDTGGRWNLQPMQPRFTGKCAFLTDGRAISYAESIMGIVENYKLGEIVGSTTAGTNGNVNPFELPGGFHVLWTGMKVLKHDGSQHHGVGIKPTVPVEPTAAGIAGGRDEVLEKAVAVLQEKLPPATNPPPAGGQK